VNTSFRRALWAEVLYACDDAWWVMYFPEVSRAFRGEKWTLNENARDRFDLHWMFGIDRAGLSPDPTYIHQGQNSGYQAVGLAHLFGAARVLLLGFDFGRTGGKSHWHGDHPRGLGNGGSFPAWIAAMNVLARDLAAAGTEVINCSRMTALKCFPRMSIEEALCRPMA
jgi:hypothetical protein